MNLTLKILRQKGPEASGKLVEYPVQNVSPDSSFLEMLDVLNDSLVEKGEEAIIFDSDCREGICGMCSLVINGVPHGAQYQGGTAACQLHMRKFKDGGVITIEPWRARAFPIVKDLACNRSAFDRIIQSGGFTSARTGGTPDANSILVGKPEADRAMDAAACIGCGACVAACKNASAMLFVAAKVSHLAQLPQGKVEARARVLNMVSQMDKEGFGNCSNQSECEAVCPKEISVDFIAQLNREYLKSLL